MKNRPSITSKRPKVDTPYPNSWADEMAKRNANTRNGIPNPPLSSTLPSLPSESCSLRGKLELIH